MPVGELFNDGIITITLLFVYLFLISDGGAVIGVSAVAVILGRFGTRFFQTASFHLLKLVVFTVGAIPAVAVNRASFSYTCSGA